MQQLSIFAENKKGTMNSITQILADAGINMNTLITNDSAEFGIVRMLVSDADAAASALKASGYMCKVDDVLAVDIRDEAGSLNALLAILTRGNLNLDYIYVTYSSFSKRPVAIIHVGDLAEVADLLEGKGYSIISAIA